MPQQQTGLAAALQRLRALGFKAVSARPSRRVFHGALRCKQGDVPVRLEIADWDFVRYPKITLRERPDFLPVLMPHVSVDGTLCYFADGAVILDRFRPDDAVWQCIEQARLVVDRAIENPDYRSSEFGDEFWANWTGNQGPFPGIVGGIGASASSARYFLVGPADEQRLYVSDDAQEVEQFCLSLNWPAPQGTLPCWIFRSTRIPAMPIGGLPDTIHAVFDWLKAWDPALSKAIQAVFGQRTYLTLPRCELVIGTPVGWIGFGFDLDPLLAKGFARKPREYRNYLHRRGGATAIQRSVYLDVSAEHVYGRSVVELHNTLAGKRIALVGCGAIGGYLAPALVRLGAGTGGGTLHLMDEDILFPDNLGRHRLGYDQLFKTKAGALHDVVVRESPFSRITRSVGNAAATMPKGFDLVIDATGDQATAEALNWNHVRSAYAPPMLHVWVFGNGDCVQGVWVDSRKYACYRCLRHNDEVQNQKERFPLTKAPALRAQVGCHAFTPYAVSAPMSAAALAMDYVIDWLKGDVSPRFRLRYTEDSTLRRFRSQDATPLGGCPACQAH